MILMMRLIADPCPIFWAAGTLINITLGTGNPFSEKKTIAGLEDQFLVGRRWGRNHTHCKAHVLTRNSRKKHTE